VTTTMDSLSPDLRDALDAAAGGGGSTDASASTSSSSSSAKKNTHLCCIKCEKAATDVDRLRWCGGCRTGKYCRWSRGGRGGNVSVREREEGGRGGVFWFEPPVYNVVS
jgi:hypothetical protein